MKNFLDPQQQLGELARQYWHVSQLVHRAICRPISQLQLFEIIERIFVLNIFPSICQK